MAQSTDPLPVIHHGNSPLWHRPHPITLVVELVQSFPALMAGLFVVNSGFDGTKSLADLAEVGVIAASTGAAVIRWLTTRYALTDESLLHERGLIWRKKQVLPRSNVQNVVTKAGIMARIAGVVELQVSDASSSNDTSIQFVSSAEAERLTTLLRPPTMSGNDQDISSEAPSDASLPHGAPLDQVPTPLVSAPIVSAPIVAPSLTEVARSELTTTSSISSALVVVLGATTAITLAIVSDSAVVQEQVEPLLFFPLVAVVAKLGFHLFQILGLGGFTLTPEPDRLRIRSGLLTEISLTTRRERIQQILVHRDLVHRRLGIEKTRYLTADTDAWGGHIASNLSPSGETDDWKWLATEAIGELQLGEDDLVSVHETTVRRVFVRFVATAFVSGWLVVFHPAALLLPLGLLLVGWVYSRVRYNTLGWARSDDQLLVRSGPINRRLHLVLLDKIQIVRMTESWFQRRLGVATVSISTAGNRTAQAVRIPDLLRSDAEQLIDGLGHRSNRTELDRII